MTLPLIVAHRGASAYILGNTRAAFQLALEQRADYIELDVHFSRDGKVIIWNPATILIQNKDVLIAELSLEELKHYWSLSLHTQEVAVDDIMTLTDLCQLLQGTGVGMMIEVKSRPIRYMGIVEAIAQIINQYRLVDEAYVVSFDYELVSAYKLHQTGARTGILYTSDLSRLRETIRSSRADLVEMRNELLTEQVVRIIHEEGAIVAGWSTTDPEIIQQLCALDVDMITTDAPDQARRIVHDFFSNSDSA